MLRKAKLNTKNNLFVIRNIDISENYSEYYEEQGPKVFQYGNRRKFLRQFRHQIQFLVRIRGISDAQSFLAEFRQSLN